MTGVVLSVSRDGAHRFSKPAADEIRLIEGFGVEGDAHGGATVQHLSRVRRDPTQPNLRQVHLIHSELFDEVADDGFTMSAGQIGENVTTRGIDLLGLPVDAVLRFGSEGASVRVTGLRNPCVQINGIDDGLMKRLVRTDVDGSVIRLAGVMAVVLAAGPIRPGDSITVELPSGVQRPLQPV